MNKSFALGALAAGGAVMLIPGVAVGLAGPSGRQDRRRGLRGFRGSGQCINLGRVQRWGGPIGNVSTPKTDEWKQMVDVNINGVLSGVAAVMPSTGGESKIVWSEPLMRLFSARLECPLEGKVKK